jgi:hypothetical protein
VTRSFVDQYSQAQRRNDGAALGSMRHRDWYVEWPQSGERIRGHENDRRIHENFPDFPQQEFTRMAGQSEEFAMSPLNTMVRVRGGGDLWVIEGLFKYSEGPLYSVIIGEIGDGLMARETMYWAAPFEAPAWRAHLAETMSGGEGFREVEAATSSEVREKRRAALVRYATAASAGTDVEERRGLYLDAMADVFHEDAVQDLPQSRERIRGLANMSAIVREHPDFPVASELRRVVGTGDLFVVEARLTYADSTWWEVAILEFRGDKVSRTIEYYGEPFEAPGWRAQWVERF